ncbi:MAG: tetratricopeptide repeat protein [Armatimonadota bacterium]
MRSLCTKLLVVAVACALVGCAERGDSIQARLERADRLLAQGKIAPARLLIEEAIRMRPSRSDTYRTVAAIYARHERTREAARTIERLLELARAGKLDEAISREELAHLHSALGELYQKLRALSQAESAYRTALSVAPRSALLMNNLAYFYADEGLKLTEALRLARMAVTLAPADGNVVDTLGWVQYKLGRYRCAARTLAEAVRLKPDEPVLRYHLGAAYARLGRRFEAYVELKKALLLNPGMREAANLLRRLR